MSFNDRLRKLESAARASVVCGTCGSGGTRTRARAGSGEPRPCPECGTMPQRIRVRGRVLPDGRRWPAEVLT
jgi:hypothetical protein